MARSPREAPPPSKWGKSPSGTYFEVTGGHKRNEKGQKLYRLLYLTPPCVKGNKEFTLDELNEDGVRWLKNKPTRKMIETGNR